MKKVIFLTLPCFSAVDAKMRRYIAFDSFFHSRTVNVNSVNIQWLGNVYPVWTVFCCNSSVIYLKKEESKLSVEKFSVNTISGRIL